MTNPNAVARHYGQLTAEERFRLILAASCRGDDAEADRLARAGERIGVSMQDHAPYAHAFNEVAELAFLDLLELAARYRDALGYADDAGETFGEADAADADGDAATGPPGTGADADPPDDDAEADPGTAERYFRVALADGYMLRARADGWQLFCKRLNVSPFALWECLPGFDRLQGALALATEAAFRPEGFLRWLNEIRPDGKPELAEVPCTAERTADIFEEAFRRRAEWWGARPANGA